MDRYSTKQNKEYREKVKEDNMQLLAITKDGNFDYYLKDKTVYSIAKTDECCSTHFGSLSYFFNIYIYHSQKYMYLTPIGYQLLLKEIKSSYYYRFIEKNIINDVLFA